MTARPRSTQEPGGADGRLTTAEAFSLFSANEWSDSRPNIDCRDCTHGPRSYGPLAVLLRAGQVLNNDELPDYTLQRPKGSRRPPSGR